MTTPRTTRSGRPSHGVLKAALRAEVEPRRDPAYAAGARRYMKSDLPFLGVRMPDLRRAWRRIFDAHPVRSRSRFDIELRELWDEAEFREERHTAIALTRCYPEWVTLPLLERLIVEGAWWDYVDNLARQVGEIVRQDLSAASDMRSWSRDENLWKRRVSIICQLGFKADTDLTLLYDTIEANLDDREFFVRKAIGWALRDYAWHDPHEVDRYVRERADRLSPLSQREATKNLARLLA
jgi:3-methyladenine DNA glycosylase AlkD